ncbi:thioredoxin family protein [Christiangramia sediminis]|uniref:Thioredoxin family protein n=1 Tax=Christiangramia sediminis TaxID=2881336 RepID=A0A9X1LKR1_9FLAO|nr:thioredoxin family protein [Christiangramia sediminis]MCB7482109.1 thioredoxin family protein [Christiangramia sediminis]
MQSIIKNSLDKSMSYPAYKSMVEQLILKDSNTGEWSVERMNFTKLNFSRMKRMDAKVEIPENTAEVFQQIDQKQYWIVLLESWCGDGAQTIPVLNKLAELSPKIELRILLRDENPEFMDLFLTNGSRSIPKLILTYENLNILTTWGPRSKAATKIMEDYKKEHGRIDDQIKKEIQIWYNRDKGQEIISEISNMEIQLNEHRLKPAS